MKHDSFFAWCERHGLASNRDIAAVFNVSSQTIRNWRSGKRLPGWLEMACLAHERHGGGARGAMPEYPRMSVLWFKDWQRRNGLATCEQTGNVFGLKRQAVHNWYRRGRFPGWISLACIGLDCRREGA